MVKLEKPQIIHSNEIPPFLLSSGCPENESSGFVNHTRQVCPRCWFHEAGRVAQGRDADLLRIRSLLEMYNLHYYMPAMNDPQNCSRTSVDIHSIHWLAAKYIKDLNIAKEVKSLQQLCLCLFQASHSDVSHMFPHLKIRATSREIMFLAVLLSNQLHFFPGYPTLLNHGY